MDYLHENINQDIEAEIVRLEEQFGLQDEDLSQEDKLEKIFATIDLAKEKAGGTSSADVRKGLALLQEAQEES